MANIFDNIGSALKGVLPTISAVAPTIATAIGGPLAGTAVTFLTKALNIAPDAPPEAIATAVAAATPDQLLALKVEEDRFVQSMASLNVDVAKLAYQDTASARAMASTGKGVTNWGAAGVSAVVMLLFGAHELAPFFITPPAVDAGDIQLLYAAVTLVLGFWLGSSSGSDLKTRLLYNSTPTK